MEAPPHPTAALTNFLMSLGNPIHRPENSKLTPTNSGKHVILVVLHLGCPTQNDSFHLFLCEFQNSVFLNRCIIFYYGNYHIFIICSSVDGHHDSFCFLIAVSRATMNMNKQFSE